jgi:hypothetical protein
VDVSAVAYYRIVDAIKSVVAIENVHAAIDQIAQTTLRKVVGQHTLDETLSETDRINLDLRQILDVTTVVFPAPLMTMIAELGAFIAETTAGPVPGPQTQDHRENEEPPCTARCSTFWPASAGWPRGGTASRTTTCTTSSRSSRSPSRPRAAPRWPAR